MKENTLDVLFYLFDTYPGMEDQVEEDRETLHDYLQSAGFHASEIAYAFDWLESLGNTAITVAPTYYAQSLRVFAPYEQQWLDTECQNHILQLEHQGLLSPTEREQVIDRVLALQDPDLDVAKLQWVIQMVVMNRADYNEADFLQSNTPSPLPVHTLH